MNFLSYISDVCSISNHRETLLLTLNFQRSPQLQHSTHPHHWEVVDDSNQNTTGGGMTQNNLLSHLPMHSWILDTQCYNNKSVT